MIHLEQNNEVKMLLFQSMVLDECKRLVEDSSDKSQTKIEELNSEIRKLKAMIGILHNTYRVLIQNYYNWYFSETRDQDQNIGDKK